jgi:hypothetical protein
LKVLARRLLLYHWQTGHSCLGILSVFSTYAFSPLSISLRWITMFSSAIPTLLAAAENLEFLILEVFIGTRKAADRGWRADLCAGGDPVRQPYSRWVSGSIAS